MRDFLRQRTGRFGRVGAAHAEQYHRARANFSYDAAADAHGRSRNSLHNGPHVRPPIPLGLRRITQRRGEREESQRQNANQKHFRLLAELAALLVSSLGNLC
jgi:hypothetical protein